RAVARRRAGPDAADAGDGAAVRRRQPVRRRAEHPGRREVPGLVAEALQRRPDPRRGRLQRRRGRGRQVQRRAAVPRNPALRAARRHPGRALPQLAGGRKLAPLAWIRAAFRGAVAPVAAVPAAEALSADSAFRYTLSSLRPLPLAAVAAND